MGNLSDSTLWSAGETGHIYTGQASSLYQDSYICVQKIIIIWHKILSFILDQVDFLCVTFLPAI